MKVPPAQGVGGGFRKAIDLLRAGAREKTYGAAVLLAAKEGEIVCHQAAGEAHLSSVFDVASLTKPLVSASFFLLGQEGKISPEGRLAEILPPKSGNPSAGEIRFSHLLSHTSGLPAWKPFHERVRAEEAREGRRLWGTSEGHDRIVDSVLSVAPEAPPGTTCVYSDLGFILLGRAMEVAGFRPLDVLLKRLLADPLQMRDTGYLPLSALSECEAGRLVSTGYSSERAREKVGEVDDENAAAMGGVAGHAGIFSTAFDLFLFSREVLRARRGEGRVLSLRSALEMTTKVAHPPGCPRTLGWDTPDPGGSSQAGRHFPEGSFGHLGYTGTSLWIDPSRGVVIALLTNRILFDKQNGGLKNLRPLIHDAVMEDLFP